MSKSKALKRRRQSDVKRKAADDHPTSDRRMKRKLNNQPGVGQDEQQATVDPSEEALFKIRYAAEFDNESVGSIGSQAIVKHEQKDLDDTASESVQFVSTVPVGPPDHPPLPPAMSSSQDANSARDGVHQEDVLIAILSQGSWDIRMTQMAVDDLARRAQQNATPGHLFDQAYINGLIRVLDTTGVEAQRRSQVITMLRASLREPLAEWKLCIDRVGSRSPPPTPHAGAGSRLCDSNSPASGPVPSSSRLLYVDIGRPVTGDTTTAWDASFHHSASRSSSEDRSAEDEETGSQHAISQSRTLSQHQASPLFSSATAPSRAANTTKPTNNLRVNGTQRPKAPFDVFAGCVILAWALAPKPEDDSVKIRTYARTKWPKLGRYSEQRMEWQKLYEARHEPDVDVPALGHQLFLSQALLRHVVPGDRLQAVRARIGFCEPRNQRIVPLTTPVQPRSLSPKRLDQVLASRESDPSTQNDNGSSIVSRKQLNLRVPVYVATPAISQYFPRFVPATSTTPLTQACFVPSSTRGYDPNGCLFVLNAPDAVAGRVITEPDVRLACAEACFEGIKDVTRHNNNIFVISFESRSKAHHADRHLKLDFPAPHTGATSSITPVFTISARRYDEGPHHVFCCAVRTSVIRQSTVYKRVFEALAGPESASFQLLKQNGTNGYVRYVLRRPASASPIHIERFYIPIDHAGGKHKTWAIFQPFKTNRKCSACYERCQVGESSTCAYATLMSKL